MKQSKLFSLNWLDILKGIILGVLTSVVEQLLDYLSKDSTQVSWSAVGRMFLIGFLGYLLKNFFTPSPKDADA